MPAPAQVHAFDGELGVMALTDSTGRPAWLDFRLGTVSVAPRSVRLERPAAARTPLVYGLDADGEVVRAEPAGDSWRFEPPVPATQVLPQPDGWLVVVARDGEATRLWRLRPPQTRITDSAIVPAVQLVVQTEVGDRLYLASGAEMLSLTGRDLEPLPTLVFDRPIRAIAATPSGDRVFVVQEGSREIAVVDRYREDVTTRIELPAEVRDLRVDPLGRYLLARPAAGDSSWIVALATGAVRGSVRSTWLADLPYVAPDGSIVLAAGNDVLVVDGESLRTVRTVAGGARDFWYPFLWDGFRPRAADAPPEPEPERGPAPDPVLEDSMPALPEPAVVDTTQPAPDTTAARPAPGFIVSFAALLSEESARELASQIVVEGRTAHVVATDRAGTTIYRVLLGPYPTREEAERVGRASGHSYWVYEEER